MIRSMPLALAMGAALLCTLPESKAYAARMCSTYTRHVIVDGRRVPVVRRYCWDTRRYGTCGPRRACE